MDCNEWKDFNDGSWKNEINVRDLSFIIID